MFVKQLSNLYIWKTSKYGTDFMGVLPDYRPDSQDQIHFQVDIFYTVS